MPTMNVLMRFVACPDSKTFPIFKVKKASDKRMRRREPMKTRTMPTSSMMVSGRKGPKR